MDKLEPFIRHRFWILGGLVVPLILYGYYSANGQLKAATAARETKLDEVKSKISPGREPNDDYVKKLEHINKFLNESVDDAIVGLWRHQQERMTWPPAVASNIPKEFMGEFDQQVPLIYKGIYPNLIQKLQERVQPVQPLQAPGTGRTGRTPSPSVSTSNQKVILAAMVPHARIGQFGMSSKEMWDAQIDIWLTELLLDAIVKINADKESVSEAVIRRVDAIQLMGGTGTPALAGGGAGEGSPMDGPMPGGPGNMGGPQVSTSIGFSPAEEFGPAGEGGGGEMSAESAPMGGGPAAAPQMRYIAETEGAPFLERGFYMTVIIQQSKIADFITILANSDWPIQVRRFQVGTNPYSKDAAGAAMNSEGGFSNSMSGFSSPMSGFSSPSFESSGFSGGPMGGNAAPALANPYGQNLPEFAMAALGNPDLVRLDLCGIITMYRQPQEALAAIEARKAAQAAEAPPAAPAESPPAAPAPTEQPGEPAMPPATPQPEGASPLGSSATPASAPTPGSTESTPANPAAPAEPAPATPAGT